MGARSGSPVQTPVAKPLPGRKPNPFANAMRGGRNGSGPMVGQALSTRHSG